MIMVMMVNDDDDDGVRSAVQCDESEKNFSLMLALALHITASLKQGIQALRVRLYNETGYS